MSNVFANLIEIIEVRKASNYEP